MSFLTSKTFDRHVSKKSHLLCLQLSCLHINTDNLKLSNIHSTVLTSKTNARRKPKVNQIEVQEKLSLI